MKEQRPCGHAALYQPRRTIRVCAVCQRPFTAAGRSVCYLCSEKRALREQRWDREGRDVTDLPGLWSADDLRVCQTNFNHPSITTGQHTNGPAMIWTRIDSDDDWIRTGETHLHRVREQWIAGHQLGKEIAMEETDRMLKWFAYTHLPEKLQGVSAPFGDLASHICNTIEPGPERTVALRKLLEAKDAAVRAVVQPGG